MAGTSVMRALRALATRHRTAARLRIPPQDVGAMDRRQLLSRAAALGVAGALAPTAAGVAGAAPQAAAATRRSQDTPRIAVVGAGIAGLAAALTLQDAGLASTVYEANPERVGGRMWTQRAHWSGGQTSEIGGELIDTEHHTVRRLCRRFGLPLHDFTAAGPQRAEDVLWFDGRYRAMSQVEEEFAAVHRALRRDLANAGEVTWSRATAAGRALDTMSVREWIETRVPGGTSSLLGQFLDVAYTVEYGADTGDQSALALVLLLGDQPGDGNFNVWGTSDERYHIAGGNDRLPHAMADTLHPGTVRHGWAVEAVRANADGSQTLTFDEGGTTRTVTADHTVLAVPLGVLQRLDLTRAAFDPRMTALVRDARMGACSKLNMQTTSRPWRGNGPWPTVSAGQAFTDLGIQQTWDATKTQPGTGGILLQYGGGAQARALTPSEPFGTEADPYVRALAADRLHEAEALYPGVHHAWTGRAQLAAWHRNPYTHGAYSYWPVGYLHRYAGYEGTRQGNVHLAGEHTSYDFQGFMNGGAESGERAAREVVSDLR